MRWPRAVLLVLACAPAAYAQPLIVVSPHPSVAPPGTTFDRARLDDLPSGSLWSLFETIEPLAAVDRIRAGGLDMARHARITVDGTSWTQTSFRWNWLDATRPDGSGLPLVLPDMSSLREVAVQYGLLPANVRGPGSLVDITPQFGELRWAGGATLELSPSSATHGRAAAPPIDGLGELLGVNVRAGGPVRGPNLRLFGAATRTRIDHAGGRAHGRAVETTASLSAYGTFARKHSFVTDMAFSDATDTAEIDALGDDRGFRVAASDFIDFERGHWMVTGTHSRIRAKRMLPLSGAIDSVRDGPAADLLPAAGQRTSASSFESVWFGKPSIGDGLLRMWSAGGAVTHAGVETVWLGSPVVKQEVLDDRPARVWTYTAAGPRSLWRRTEVAGYVSHDLRLGRHDDVVVEAGVRVDSTIAQAVRWFQVSPRTSATWHVRDEVDLRGGYGRYAHRLPLTYLAFGDPTAPSAEVRRTDGVLVARLGPGGSSASIDSALASPSSDEIVAGIEWEAFAKTRFGVTGIRRRDRHLIGTINTALGPSDFDVRYIPDPGGDLAQPSDDQRLPVYDRHPDSFGRDRELLTNLPDGNSVFEALVFTAEHRAARWWMRAAASASRTIGRAGAQGFSAAANDQDALGGGLLSPNDNTFDRGRLFFDRAFTIKLAGSVHAPFGLSIGWIARYQDGQPFSRLVVVDDLAQGPEAIRAVPNGRHRFQYLSTVDIRVARTFTVSGKTVTVSLDAFNLLNDANEVEESVVTGPRFRAVTAVQPPRTIRLGLRFRF